MPLAGGENLIGAEAFDAALASPALRVLQPDLTKWGGISGGLPLARRIVASGRRYAPHVFAGAPGLLAATHLFAAGGSRDGILEYGVGRHPARDALLARELRDGAIVLGEAPGLGLVVDTEALAPYRVAL
jgi:L-alanine-DL-glutamate epimerase-like enolase superfamily enzyme